MKPKHIGLVGFDRVNALHLIGSAEAFSAAALDDGYGGRIPCYEVHLVAVRSDRFQAESGVTFSGLADLEHAPDFDTIIVAGGSGIHAPGIADSIADWILRRVRTVTRIGTICTGIYGLAPTGLLDGHEVTVHWRHASDVARRFPQLRVNHQRPFLQAGACYTSSGLSAGLNLSLAFIRGDYGPHVAQAVSRDLVLFPAEPDRSATVPGHHLTERFADLVAWIVRNLDSDLSVTVLARRACICPTHFSKAFKSVFGEPPTEFVENLRLHEARRRLSKRQRTLQSVATSVGFTNTDTFQRAFERRFGARPSSFLAPEARAKTRKSALASAA